MKYFEAYIDNGTFEAATTDVLANKIVAYYSPQFGPMQRIAPQVTSLVLYEHDDAKVMGISQFNALIQDKWDMERLHDQETRWGTV